jgi:hypothetical protein
MTKAIKRSEVIHVRLTEEERARFADLRAPGDLPVSEGVRAINVGNAPEAAAMRTTFEGFAEMLWEVEESYRSLCAAARERRRATEGAP